MATSPHVTRYQLLNLLVLAHRFPGQTFVLIWLVMIIWGHLDGTDLEPVTYAAAAFGGSSSMTDSSSSPRDSEWHHIDCQFVLT